ncbi:AP2 domain-containing protein [Cryptosporidium felis]|nr:AP2 domain-containing protein [Cryptosporidium felis]
MVALANQDRPTIFENQNSSLNPLESSDSTNSDIGIEETKPIEETSSSGLNSVFLEPPRELVESGNLETTVDLFSHLIYPVPQGSSPSHRTHNTTSRTRSRSNSSSSTRRSSRPRVNKTSKSSRNRSGGCAAGARSSSRVSPQEVERAIILNYRSFKKMSLKGIYYDRRNHGWQVRIRKRQTEISRYFSAKRYGVERSYEMALRFYHINIIGNFGNEFRLAKESEDSDVLSGVSELQRPLTAVTRGRRGGRSGNRRSQNGVTNSSAMDDVIIPAVDDDVQNNLIGELIRPDSNIPAPLGTAQNNCFVPLTKIQGDSVANNPQVSHSIPNNFLNNILVSQMFANNLFTNAMTNIGNTSGFQLSGLPFNLIPQVAAPQTPVQWNSNSVTRVVSPVIPSVHTNTNSRGTTSADPQLLLKELISRGISDSEGVWMGICFDNRNGCWRLCLEGFPERAFSTVEFGEAESLALVVYNKFITLRLRCDVIQIFSIVSGYVNELKRMLSMSLGAVRSSSSAEDENNDRSSTRKFKCFREMSISEKMENFGLNELIAFITLSHRVRQVLYNSPPRYCQLPVPNFEWPAAIIVWPRSLEQSVQDSLSTIVELSQFLGGVLSPSLQSEYAELLLFAFAILQATRIFLWTLQVENLSS